MYFKMYIHTSNLFKKKTSCDIFSAMRVPDFESESVEYLLPSALPSLKSENGPLFPVSQVMKERKVTSMFDSCQSPCFLVTLRCLEGTEASWDLTWGILHSLDLIIGSQKSLSLEVKILILLTCTLPSTQKKDSDYLCKYIGKII